VWGKTILWLIPQSTKKGANGRNSPPKSVCKVEKHTFVGGV